MKVDSVIVGMIACGGIMLGGAAEVEAATFFCGILPNITKKTARVVFDQLSKKAMNTNQICPEWRNFIQECKSPAGHCFTERAEKVQVDESLILLALAYAKTKTEYYQYLVEAAGADGWTPSENCISAAAKMLSNEIVENDIPAFVSEVKNFMGAGASSVKYSSLAEAVEAGAVDQAEQFVALSGNPALEIVRAICEGYGQKLYNMTRVFASVELKALAEKLLSPSLEINGNAFAA